MASPFPSKTELVILQLLLGGRRYYGLELVHASNNKVKRGTVYVLLDRLEQKGFVASHTSTEKTDRRHYVITASGRRVVGSLDAGMTTSSAEAFA